MNFGLVRVKNQDNSDVCQIYVYIGVIHPRAGASQAEWVTIYGQAFSENGVFIGSRHLVWDPVTLNTVVILYT